MVINGNITLEELNDLSELKDMKNLFITGWNEQFSGEQGRRTLNDLQAEYPAWDSEDISYGLNRLSKIAASGIQYVYELKDGGNLIYLPSDDRKSEYYFILCAGGAYGSVCTMVESLPVAAKLNEMGFDCFCLSYHVATAESFVSGLMPQPLADLALAIKFIGDNEEFSLDHEKYFLAGFSAGGHLVSCFSLNSVGAAHYGVSQPKGLLLAYPLISLDTFENQKVRDFMMAGLFGAADTAKTAEKYDIIMNMDESFPQTFYTYCLDDDSVPIINADIMKKALEDRGIRNEFICFQEGGHGFGLGSKITGNNYVEKAISFLLKGVNHE
ncbi:MAG: alpha/beta hydrolase [Erysipelotrichaceae bacterium]|nr:alpha/beta hydrolase [Erysipelotrichaceae bacterium]MBQ4457323.1 alpha/beta hydrolase [Clostridia bacterium]